MQARVSAYKQNPRINFWSREMTSYQVSEIQVKTLSLAQTGTAALLFKFNGKPTVTSI
jgi:hypothetical protein